MAALAWRGPIGREPGLAMGLYGAGFLLMAGMARFFPHGISGSRAFPLIILIGLAGRALFFFYPPGNDLYRYLWEGAIQLEGFNPYLYPPDHPDLARLSSGELAPIWAGINHRSLPAIYPPASELLFLLLALVSPTVLAFKGAMIAFEVGTLLFLSLLLKQKELHPARLLFYAANPLVIVFLVGEGHIDAFQVFLLTAAVYFLAYRREGLGSFLLGAACLAKYLAVVTVPFWFLRRQGRGRYRLFFFAPLALFLPYAAAGGGLGSLSFFALEMHYNDGLMEILRSLFGDGALFAAVLILLGGIFWAWLITDDPLRASYLALGLLLLLLPTLHPWYLCLIAPLLCLFPQPAWLYLQGAMLFTFPVMGVEYHTGVFQELPWIKHLEYLPFYALLLIGWLRRWSLRGEDGVFPGVRTISAVVPAWNEAPLIGRTLGRLRVMPQVIEVRVADGGSADDTVEVARSYGAVVVSAPRGRGRQIQAAAAAAQGDVIWVVHADGMPQPDAAGRILEALNRYPEAPGGAFSMAFDGESTKERLTALLNNARAFLTGISFGDQGQFVRRAALGPIGGMPGLRLMEDVEFSLRLKRFGRPLHLRRGIVVSGRRWRDGNYWGKLSRVVFLFFRFLVERRLRPAGVRDGFYLRFYYPKDEGGDHQTAS
ncbi:MAG: glycosyltransferase [Desulfobacterales bacterium]